jgi:hypothetical protein
MSHYLITFYENSYHEIFPKEIRGLENPKSFKKVKKEIKHTSITTQFFKALTDPKYYDENDYMEFISY